MLFRCAIFLCCILLTASLNAAPLTMDEAVRLALVNQPLLARQRALLEADTQFAVSEGELPDPKLKLGVNNVPTNNFSLTQDFMTQSTVSVEQRFPGGKKRQLKQSIAELKTSQNTAELDTAIRNVKRNAALAWLNLYYLTNTRTTLAEQEEEIRKQIEAARILYRSGKIGQGQILSAQAMLNQLLDREAGLTAQAFQAKADLERWIGKGAEREPSINLPDKQNIPPLDQIEAQLPSHPEIRKLDQEIAEAQANLSLAQESNIPDWGIEVGYSKRGPAFSDMVSAQVVLDLPVFPGNRQDRLSESKKYLLEVTRSQREDRLRNLTAELNGSYVTWLSTASRIALFKRQIIPAAQQRITAMLIAYKTGTATMLDVFESHHAELETRLQLLAQQVARTRAEVQLGYFLKLENKQ